MSPNRNEAGARLGRQRIIKNWKPVDADLKPLVYQYRVPDSAR